MVEQHDKVPRMGDCSRKAHDIVPPVAISGRAAVIDT
jgi:hypothetical protein